MKNWDISIQREHLAIGFWLMRGWFGMQFLIVKLVIRRISEIEKHEAELSLRAKMDSAKDGDMVRITWKELNILHENQKK